MSIFEKVLFDFKSQQRNQLFGKLYRWILVIVLTHTFCQWKGLYFDISNPIALIQKCLDGAIIPIMIFFYMSYLIVNFGAFFVTATMLIPVSLIYKKDYPQRKLYQSTGNNTSDKIPNEKQVKEVKERLALLEADHEELESHTNIVSNVVTLLLLKELQLDFMVFNWVKVLIWISIFLSPIMLWQYAVVVNFMSVFKSEILKIESIKSEASTNKS